MSRPESLTRSQSMATTVNPVEFVRGLPDERKEEVFFALLRDFYAGHAGESRIPLQEGDTDLGYLVPPPNPGIAYEAFLKTLPAEVAERLRQPIPDDLDLDDVFTDEEIRAIDAATEAQTSTGHRHPA